jgi:hypothetical protein
VKPVPVRVRIAPPVVVPVLGDTPVTVAVDAALNVNRSEEDSADVPAAVVTLRSSVPAGVAGVVAPISVSENTVNPAAGVDPNATPFAPLKPVPVMRMTVPPAVLADDALSEVTVGADTAE